MVSSILTTTRPVLCKRTHTHPSPPTFLNLGWQIKGTVLPLPFVWFITFYLISQATVQCMCMCHAPNNFPWRGINHSPFCDRGKTLYTPTSVMTSSCSKAPIQIGKKTQTLSLLWRTFQKSSTTNGLTCKHKLTIPSRMESGLSNSLTLGRRERDSHTQLSPDKW